MPGAGRAVIHELSFGIQRLVDGRRKERFRSYLQNLLSSGLPVLHYDNAAALWHGEQRARLEARGLRPGFADGQIATTSQILAGGKHLRRPL